MALLFDNVSNTIGGLTKIEAGNNLLTISNTQGLVLPSGTISQRPVSPPNGVMRNNTDLGVIEQYVNGVWQPMSSSGGRGFGCFFDDFLIDAGVASGSLFGRGWTTFTTGAGASVASDFTVITAANDTAGVLALNTGTTATGTASPFLSENCFVAGYGSLYFEARLQIPILTTGTQTFGVRLGFKDDSTTVGNNGAFIFLTGIDTLWRGTTRNAGASTNVSSAITVVAGQWYRVGIFINSAGTQADFYVDDVLFGSNTTNLPAAGNTFGINVMIQKTNGIIARIMNVDYVQVIYTPTTAR